MRRLLLVLALAAVLAAPLAAQRRARRDSFWFGAGLGSGWVRVGCDICQTNRGAALSGYLNLGGQLSQRLLIGAEANGWTRGEDDVDEMVWGLHASVYWFSNPRRPLFWRAGAGLLSYRAEDDQDVLSSSAFGLVLGAGYDAEIGGRLALTPFFNLFVASPGGEIKFNGADILGDASLVFLQVGMGLTRR